MRRAVAGIVLALVVTLAGVPAASGAAPTPDPPMEVVTPPYVGFKPLFAPWWLEHVARTKSLGSTMTALYLADTGTPTSGRAFALVRGTALPGAERCGVPVPNLDIRTGPFRRAEAVQAGPVVILRRTNVRPGRPLAMLVARDLTIDEITQLARQAGVRKGVLAPRTIPNDLHLAGLAPVDATLTSGPGTSFRVLGDIDGARRVEVHATVLHGPAETAAAFFRASSVGMSCTPARYSLTTVGAATVAATGTFGDDAGRVATMVRTVGRAGYATNVGWVRDPGPTQWARRCASASVATVAGQNHGRLWGVGFPAQADAPMCVARRSGGTLTPPEAVGRGAVVISLHRPDACGYWILAGRAPADTRRVVIRAGRAPAQRGHLRTLQLRAAGPPDGVVWAALVRGPAVLGPAITVTAYDSRGRARSRTSLRGTSTKRCRPGRPVATTVPSP